MKYVSHLFFNDRQPFINILNQWSRPGQVQAYRNRYISEIILGKQRWDDIALILAGHLIAMDELLASVSFANVGIVK